MSSNTNAVTAKLAKHANVRKQLEERHKQLEEEAEQEHLKEERLAQELEEMRAEEECKVEEKREAERQAEEEQKVEEARENKRWAEEWRKQEKEEARATKVFAQKEVEVLRKQLDEAKRKKELKRSRPESEAEVEVELEKEEAWTRESTMLDRKIVWRTKARKICKECQKGARKCLWPEASS